MFAKTILSKYPSKVQLCWFKLFACVMQFFIIYIRFYLKSRKSEIFPKLSHEFADAVIAFV